jgi:hypothetical protein
MAQNKKSRIRKATNTVTNSEINQAFASYRPFYFDLKITLQRSIGSENLKPSDFLASVPNNELKSKHFNFIESLYRENKNVLLALLCQLECPSDWEEFLMERLRLWEEILEICPSFRDDTHFHHLSFWKQLLNDIFGTKYIEYPSLEHHLKFNIKGDDLAKLFKIDKSSVTRAKNRSLKPRRFSQSIKKNWLINLIAEDDNETREKVRFHNLQTELKKSRTYFCEINPALIELLKLDHLAFFEHERRYKNVRDMIVQFLAFKAEKCYFTIEKEDGREIENTYNRVATKLFHCQISLNGASRTQKVYLDVLQSYPELWIYLLLSNQCYNIKFFQQAFKKCEIDESNPIFLYKQQGKNSTDGASSLIVDVCERKKIKLTTKEKNHVFSRIQHSGLPDIRNEAASAVEKIIENVKLKIDSRYGNTSADKTLEKYHTSRAELKKIAEDLFGGSTSDSFMGRLMIEISMRPNMPPLDVLKMLYKSENCIELLDFEGHTHVINCMKEAKKIGIKSLKDRIEVLSEEYKCELNEITGSYELITRSKNRIYRVSAGRKTPGKLYIALFSYEDAGKLLKVIKVGFTTKEILYRLSQITKHTDATYINLQLEKVLYSVHDNNSGTEFPVAYQLESDFHDKHKNFKGKLFGNRLFEGKTEFYVFSDLENVSLNGNLTAKSTWEEYFKNRLHSLQILEVKH